MCGFSGFANWAFSGATADPVCRAMSDSLEHRGPDADGFWQDSEAGIALVHRRLAIQDLSPLGAQPMVSASGRLVIAFNGEIYNFETIQSELISLGHSFRGHSDTEVMLAAFEQWGLQVSLEKFAGMFAFALVDREEGVLHLARDRMGEKPLYYGWQQGTLLFGSELKALRQHPDWVGEIDRSVLPLLLRHNLIPAPHSIYQGICKLVPASYVSFRLESLQPGVMPEPQRYWQLEAQFAEGPGQTLEGAANELEKLLTEVISEQMISDVPLGAFLSGGIDSSTIVALMQKQANTPVKSFSIGFKEAGFNEAEHAAAVARHLGTEHTELYVSEQDALDVIPKLPQMYCEPFADSSQIPTYLVSKMTKQKVTVALSGDGGDELFCGYTRYPAMVSAWHGRKAPKARLKSALSRLPEAPMAALIKAAVPSQRGRSIAAIKQRLAFTRAVSGADSLSEYYRQRVSYWPFPEQLLGSVQEAPYGLTAPLPDRIAPESLKTLMWRDLNWYLPDDILVKVDRAAMACSLETRVPLLDHRVVSFALGLPASLNIQDGVGKQVLRSVLYRHVPRELIDRPKQGFAVPIAQWLRGALRDWAEGLLDYKSLTEQGYWNSDAVRWFWNEHLSGREDYSFELWGILMFQAWLDS
ncbi:asparagine synthase (glutamine-hydrolyzing) [Marinobacter flavimaris]|uniref:asparagine synthase (glutamine-hydrolyzing) n=1 Tax=Marinobacter flavimaris TaxID=262076 RepID=UPI003865DB0C